jgi:hypothetical protein
MSLVGNLAVGATAVLALSSKPGTRQINIPNLGTGTLFYQTVVQNAAPTLTTSNGTRVPNPGAVDNVIVTPGLDLPTGFDLYLISGSSTTAWVQTAPF